MNYPTIHKEFPSVLSDWGPFSKHLAGVSHIENNEKGELLEFCVFPAQYRGALQLPMEVYQCNHYPWYAREDLKFFTYRFELEWKDQVYADVSYWVKDDKTVWMRAECVNNTDMCQNLSLHTLVNRYRPAMVYAKGSAVAVDPLAYDKLELCTENRLSGLTPDGKLVGEVLGSKYVNAHALGDIFAKTPGDKAVYTVAAPGADTLYVRACGKGKLAAGGVCNAEIAPENDDFVLLSFPLEKAAGKLTLTCVEPGVMVDYIGLGKAGEEPVFTAQGPAVRPQLEENGASVVMTYEEMENCYGIAWEADLYEVREFLTDRLEYDMPFNTHNHVSKVIGSGSNQYTNVFIRPIPVEAKATKTFYAVFTCGSKEEVDAALAGFDTGAMAAAFPTVPADEGTYALSQRLMRATLLTNVVYPVRLQGRYVRHFTPGAWWDSLYTWDNGFIAMGLSDFAPELARECLHTYLTEPGDPHCAFIHHGSMVPVQAYVYKKIFDTTGDREFLREYYDSMKQYYDFYSGRSPLSHTKDLNSGLVCTFRYFYNSGGWDDYPPQHAIFQSIMQGLRSGDRARMAKAMEDMGKVDRYATASNTSHAINFARIMAHAAAELGYDTAEYEADIKAFGEALQSVSYDKESGYFSYVVHDANGDPKEFLRDANGVNHNMGLDGAYPLMAGVCTPEQQEELSGRIMSKEHMWTDIGISVVDQSAPYYKRDGYWNGSVWMPHQWFAFWGMLEYAYDEYAARIAETGLNTWKNEADYSYRCYEHFMVESRRGAGWHCFGGLSAPVVMWNASLYTPGHVTAPVNLRVTAQEESETADRLCVAPVFAAEGESTVLYVPHGEVNGVTVNGIAQQPKKTGNALMIHVPKDKNSEICILY
ncbi:MAG: hypothetical protein IKU17_07270 [Clostridia bacterium]|nr:hypothetical protein [Clostridia bacterium]